MRTRSVAVSVLIGLLSMGGCEALPTESGLRLPSETRLDQSSQRPFRFTLVGNANPDFGQGPCNVVNVESGTGVAQHLGRVTWSSTEVANFCIDPSNPAVAAVTGNLTIIAANGDELSASYTSTVNADFALGSLTAAGSYTVTGGTGRFSDASGSGVIDVSGSLAPPFGVAGTFTGVLGY